MEAENGIFSVKLTELERQYRETVRCLHRYQQEDHAQIVREIEALRREYQKNESLMEQAVQTSRSPAVAELSRVHLEYEQCIRRVLQEKLPGYLHEENSDAVQDQAEAACLYGEYAIDFVSQAMRRAQLAALWAIDLQQRCEETHKQTEEITDE